MGVVLYNPASVTLGSTSLTGVVSIAWSETNAQITAPAGDGETHTTVNRFGTATCNGQIVFRDQVQALAAQGASGTLGATIPDAEGGSSKTLAIVGVTTGNLESTVGHDSPGSASISFAAESAAGTATPVSLT